MSWIERNQHATKEEYVSKLQELTTAMKPLQDVMMGGQMPSQDDLQEAMNKAATAKASTTKEPNIADVD